MRLLAKLLVAQSTFGNDLGKLSEAIGARSEGSLRASLQEFCAALQGAAGTHMEKLAVALAAIAHGMEETSAGLTEAASRMASGADRITEQVGRDAEQATARIARQAEGLVGELRTLAEQSRSLAGDALAETARRIADAGSSFGHGAGAAAASLEQAVLGIATRLSSECEAATRRTTEELANAVAALRDLAELNRAAGDEATRRMADRIGEAAAGFERSAARAAEAVGEALVGGARDAAARLTAAVEALDHQFTRLTGELAGNLETAGSQFARQGRDGATALAEAAQAAASALKDGGRESGDALRSGGAGAGRALQDAAGGLAAPARELRQGVLLLQNGALELQRSLQSLQRAPIEATPAELDLVEVAASAPDMAADRATAARRTADRAGDGLADAALFFGAIGKALEIDKPAPAG